MSRFKSVIAVFAVLLVAAAAVVFSLQARRSTADYATETRNGVAMGTIVSITLYDETKPALAERAMALVDSLEQVISWRIESSPVAKLNRSGTTENALVSDAVSACAPISEATDGSFDLTVGKVSALWDFGGENERLPRNEEIADALLTVDYRKLKTDGALVCAAKGQQLDLGAVGKGLTCDKLNEFFAASGVKGAVASVGGSIVCFGRRNAAGDPWRVAIRHPRKENALLGTIRLKEGFVSTSGDYEKTFESDGKRYFHILDARTGYPAETGLCSVTVVCGNGLLSDALSTACFLLGEERSKPLLQQYDAAAVFVTSDGAVSTFGDIDFTADES